MSKYYYFWVIFLVIAGLLVSYFIWPREHEVAYMNLVDKKFSHALGLYQSKYDKGDRSIDVIIPLSTLYLQYGEVDKAVVMIEKFVEQHPESIEARKQLGVLYQYAQRPDDYLANLEVIYTLDPNEQVLRDLSDIYNFNGQYEAQIAVLHDLIENYTPEEEDYIRLSYMYSNRKDYDKAVEILNQLIDEHSGDFKPETVEFAISVMLDADEKEWAITFAQDYLDQTKKVEHAIMLASRVHNKGYVDEALLLLAPFADQAEDHPKLLMELISLKLAQGEEEEAFALLNEMFAKDKINEENVEPFLEIAVDRKDIQLLDKIIESIHLSSVEQDVLLSLIIVVMEIEEEHLLGKLKDNLGNKIGRFPILVHVYAVRNGSETKIISGKNVPPRQRLALARIYFLMGKRHMTMAMLEQMKKDGVDEQVDALSLANFYLLLDKPEEGLAVIEQRRENLGIATLHLSTRDQQYYHQQVNTAWLLLSTAAGKEKEVLSYIENNPDTISVPTLKDLYYTATRYKHPQIAMAAARLVYNKENSKEVSVIFAGALMQEGKTREALPLLRAYRYDDMEVVPAYVKALAKEARGDKTLQEELSQYIDEFVLTDRVPLRYKRDVGYVLADAGKRSHAAKVFETLTQGKGFRDPDVQQLLYIWGKHPPAHGRKWIINRAMSGGPQERLAWLKHLRGINQYDMIIKIAQGDRHRTAAMTDIYLEALQEKKQYQMLGEIIAYELSQNPSPERAKKLLALGQGEAYQLLAAKDRLYAEKVFMAMSKYAPFNSDPVQQILTLWGPRPSPKNVDWIVARAQSADPQSQIPWLEYLHYIGEDQKILEILDGNPSLTAAQKVQYVSALSAVGDRSKLTALLPGLISQTSDRKQLEQLGMIARSSELPAIAGMAYTKLYKAYPENNQYRRHLWMLAIDEGRFAETKAYLREYLAKNDGSYLEHFHYGELLWRDNQRNQAKPYYKTALTKIDGLIMPDIQAKSAVALIQYRLGNIEAAHAAYQKLVKQYPTNQDIRTDYATMLIEKGRTSLAKSVLAPDVSKISRSQIFPWYHLQETNSILTGNALLLAFDRELTNIDTATILKETEGWVKEIDVGYNIVHIILEPGIEGKAYQNSPSITVDMSLKETGIADKRSAIAWSRLLWQEGKSKKAMGVINKLAKRYPNDHYILQQQASMLSEQGKWRQALTTVKHAKALAPNHEDIVRIEDDIMHGYGDFVDLEIEYLETGDTREELRTKLQVEADTIKNTKVGAIIARNDVKADLATNSNTGVSAPFEDELYRGQIYAIHTLESGNEVTGRLFFSDSDVGAGGDYLFYNRFGNSRLRLEFNRANWDFLETLAGEGTRHRAELLHTHRFRPLFITQIGGAYNQYDLDGTTNALSTVSLIGNINYLLDNKPYITKIFGDRSVVSFRYSVDGEYEVENKTTVIAGTAFTPFPFSDREIHTGVVSLLIQPITNLEIETYGGYSWDRLGDDGPNFGGRIVYAPIRPLEFRFEGSRTISGDTDESLDRLSGGMRWWF